MKKVKWILIVELLSFVLGLSFLIVQLVMGNNGEWAQITAEASFAVSSSISIPLAITLRVEFNKNTTATADHGSTSVANSGSGDVSVVHNEINGSGSADDFNNAFRAVNESFTNAEKLISLFSNPDGPTFGDEPTLEKARKSYALAKEACSKASSILSPYQKAQKLTNEQQAFLSEANNLIQQISNLLGLVSALGSSGPESIANDMSVGYRGYKDIIDGFDNERLVATHKHMTSPF